MPHLMRSVAAEAPSSACMLHSAQIAIVTSSIGEINISSDKNVLIIRAACREDQHAENCDFDDAQDSANHHAIPNPQVPMRNPKFKLTFPLSRLVMRICYASMHKQNGPVAQRLEQGTHNSRESFFVRFHRLAHRCRR